jgi:SAM-dependent methyltransferase
MTILNQLLCEQVDNPEDLLDTAIDLVLKLKKMIINISESVNEVGEMSTFTEIESLVSRLNHLRNILTTKSSFHEQQLKKIFQAHILKFMTESDFVRNALEKKRGYAGDFEMMEMIWNGIKYPQRHRYLGTTDTGKYINALVLDTENCQANIHRVNHLKKIIAAKTGNRVASIGSGSAIEIRELIHAGTITFDIIDLFDADPGGFELLKKLVNKEHHIKFNYVGGNIFKSILSIPNNTYDCVYSSGLFDYFDMKSSKNLSHKLWKSVKPGGILLIINEHPNNPNKMWMEYCAEWYLQYKTEAEMVSLVDGLMDVENYILKVDGYSIYQYLEITKARK